MQPAGAPMDTGTTITFWPDHKVFGHAEWRLDLIHDRMRETCYLNPGLTVQVVDARKEPESAYSFYFEGGIVSYVRYLNQNKNVLHQPIYISRWPVPPRSISPCSTTTATTRAPLPTPTTSIPSTAART